MAYAIFLTSFLSIVIYCDNLFCPQSENVRTEKDSRSSLKIRLHVLEEYNSASLSLFLQALAKQKFFPADMCIHSVAIEVFRI